MAKTYEAPFAQTWKTWLAVVTGACTDIDSAPDSDCALLGTAHATEGGILTQLTAMPRETTSGVHVLYLFSSIDGGTDWILINAKAAAADTLSTTDAPTVIDFGYSETNPLRLQAGEKLKVGASVALTTGWAFQARVGDMA